MKYRLTREIKGRGKEGDIVELSDEEFNKTPKNVSLVLLNEVKDKEEIEMKEKEKDMLDFMAELVNEVGFSSLRATKVIKKFTKEELLKNLKKLPFNKVENDTLLNYYGGKKPKKQKKEDK